MSESKEERNQAMRELLAVLTEAGWVQRSVFDGTDIAVEWTEEIQGALKPLDRLFSDFADRLTPLHMRCLGFLIDYCLQHPPESDDTRNT